MILISTTKEMA